MRRNNNLCPMFPGMVLNQLLTAHVRPDLPAGRSTRTQIFSLINEQPRRPDSATQRFASSSPGTH